MKRRVLIFLLICAVAGGVSAQLDPFMPINPITAAQGGAFTAYAEGMNTFFYNPAGFLNDDGELTLASVSVYTRIDKSLIDYGLSMAGLDGSKDIFSDLGLPAEFSDLYDDVMVITEWYDTLATADQDAALQAASDTLAAIDPDLADALDGLDTSTDEGLATLVTIVLESPILETAEGSDTTNLVAIVNAMNDAAVAGTGSNLYSYNSVEYGTVSEAEMNESVKAVEESIPGGEIRVGMLGGVAYTGHGLGLGLFVSADGTFSGDTILDTEGRLLTAITVAGGYALPIGPFKVGFQLRPTLLGYTNVYPADAMIAMMNGGDASLASIFSEAVYSGVYVGADVGALWDFGPFTVGATMKDILPIPVRWSSYADYAAYASGMASGQFIGPLEVDQDGLYQIPKMKLNVGAQFHPDLGPLSWIVDPRVNVDFHDLLGFLRYINQDSLSIDKATLGESYSFIERVHLGAEAGFLGGLFSARAGFNGGYLSGGLGMHLLILDLNLAVEASEFEITENNGLQYNQLGLALEMAIRF